MLRVRVAADEPQEGQIEDVLQIRFAEAHLPCYTKCKETGPKALTGGLAHPDVGRKRQRGDDLAPAHGEALRPDGFLLPPGEEACSALHCLSTRRLV